MLFSLLGATTSSLVTDEEACKCEAIAALQDSVTSRLEALSTKHILFHMCSALYCYFKGSCFGGSQGVHTSQTKAFSWLYQCYGVKSWVLQILLCFHISLKGFPNKVQVKCTPPHHLDSIFIMLDIKCCSICNSSRWCWQQMLTLEHSY